LSSLWERKSHKAPSVAQQKIQVRSLCGLKGEVGGSLPPRFKAYGFSATPLNGDTP